MRGIQGDVENDFEQKSYLQTINKNTETSVHIPLYVIGGMIRGCVFLFVNFLKMS